MRCSDVNRCARPCEGWCSPNGADSRCKRRDRASESLDQASRNRNRPRRLAPECQLRFRSFDPALGKWSVATPLFRRCEDEPSLREIARNHGAEHAHLSSIKRFSRAFASIKAAAAVATLWDDVPYLPELASLIPKFPVRHGPNAFAWCVPLPPVSVLGTAFWSSNERANSKEHAKAQCQCLSVEMRRPRVVPWHRRHRRLHAMTRLQRDLE